MAEFAFSHLCKQALLGQGKQTKFASHIMDDYNDHISKVDNPLPLASLSPGALSVLSVTLIVEKAAFAGPLGFFISKPVTAQ